MTVMIDLDDLIVKATVSLTEARKSLDTDLFVLNTCDLGGLKQKGDLKLKIFMEGKYVKVTVPDTWIPWEITKYTTRAVWLKDPVFANLVDKKIITIINSNIAREILDLDEADIEHRKLVEREQRYENGFRDVEHNNQLLIDSERDRQKVRDAVDRSTASKQQTQSKLKIKTTSMESQSTNIKLVAIMNNTQLDEMSKLNAIINIKNELQISDYDYIMNRLSTKETRIKDWVIRTNR